MKLLEVYYFRVDVPPEYEADRPACIILKTTLAKRSRPHKANSGHSSAFFASMDSLRKKDPQERFGPAGGDQGLFVPNVYLCS